MKKSIGSTLFFSDNIYIAGRYSIAGRNEGNGPLGEYFDRLIPNALWGEDSFEKCERKLFTSAVSSAIADADKKLDDIDMLFGGDLLNQIISAGYSARDLGIPFLGIYGACSTYAEGLLFSSVMVDAGFADSTVCAASSHFAASERQFRFPLELGTPKTPSSQNTVTGAGAAVVSKIQPDRPSPTITCATVGRVVDPGVTDANNMGAAMAPAAVETILTHFENTGKSPKDYDAIITGDLGNFGSDIFRDFAKRAGCDMMAKHYDCGNMIFKGAKDEYCGGSGCACGAVVMNAYFLKKLVAGEYKRILFAATGALLSKTIVMQKDSIPSISHAVEIERSE